MIARLSRTVQKYRLPSSRKSPIMSFKIKGVAVAMKNILMLAASACAVCAFGAETYYVSTNGPHEVKGVVWGTYVTDDGVAYDAYTDL